MNDLQIELAQPADIDRFVEMHEEIRDWLEKRGATSLPPGIHRESSGYYSESIRRNEVYLAFANGATVGAFRLLAQDDIVWPDASNDALYLYGLIVLRRWAGHGFGREMLAWCEKRVRLEGKTFLRLDCFADNPFLRRYYETAGYSDRHEVDAVYPFATLRLARYEKRC